MFLTETQLLIANWGGIAVTAPAMLIFIYAITRNFISWETK